MTDKNNLVLTIRSYLLELDRYRFFKTNAHTDYFGSILEDKVADSSSIYMIEITQ